MYGKSHLVPHKHLFIK